MTRGVQFIGPNFSLPPLKQNAKPVNFDVFSLAFFSYNHHASSNEYLIRKSSFRLLSYRHDVASLRLRSLTSLAGHFEVSSIWKELMISGRLNDRYAALASSSTFAFALIDPPSLQSHLKTAVSANKLQLGAMKRKALQRDLQR
jgi:hypothetical protein